MNKLLTLLLLMASSFYCAAQSDSTKTKLKPYLAVGVSIGNVDPGNSNIDNFSKASYPSAEIGLMGENVSLGAVFGTENFMATSSTRGFYELKTSISKPLGNCSVYGLFGVGAYFEKKFNNFLEYGAGFSYMPNKTGYFVQYSNWAMTNYVSTGLVISF